MCWLKYQFLPTANLIPMSALRTAIKPQIICHLVQYIGNTVNILVGLEKDGAGHYPACNIGKGIGIFNSV